MKGKVLAFIIGLLVGAIITTGIFLILQKNNILTGNNQEQFQGGPEGQMMDPNSVPPAPPNMDGNSMMGEPPVKPDGQNNMPPEMQVQTTNTSTEFNN